MEGLAPGVAVRPLRDADQRKVIDTQAGKDLSHGIELTFPAIDEYEVRPWRGDVVGRLSRTERVRRRDGRLGAAETGFIGPRETGFTGPREGWRVGEAHGRF